MNLDLNDYVKRLTPWDFSVTIGEKRHRMRRALVGDLAALMAAEKAGTLDVGVLRDSLASLFMDPKPDLGALDMEVLAIVAREYVAAFQESTKKNGEALGISPATNPRK